MREIPLTRGQVAIVDDDDYEWASQFKWHTTRNAVGIYYAERATRINGIRLRVLMHRALLGLFWSMDQVDHVNHIGTDNQRANLRRVSVSQNHYNMRPQAGCVSRYKGVAYNRPKGKWQAYIKSPSKRLFLGLFDNEIDAARAYDRAALKLFGEYAYTNQQHFKKED